MTRTSSILFWFSLIIIASLGLYRTSDRVQQVDEELRKVNAAIDKEKSDIHVLKAEWSYLASPSRVEEISKKHLALRPTSPMQVATLDTLSERIPTRVEAMANVAVHAMPVANIRSTMAVPTVLSSSVKTKKPTVVVAKAETNYVRDHMTMVQHTASAAPLPGDRIASLIGDLETGR